MIFFIGFCSYGQTEIEKDYLDTNNFVQMNKISVRQFVNELRIPKKKPHYPLNIIYILHTVGKQDTNWITKEDVEYLMTFIDSNEEAKCIMRVVSSDLPFHERPILGDQVILLINAYRRKLEFPYGFTLCGDFRDNERTELKEWWQNEKIK